MKERNLRYTCVLTTVELVDLYKDPCSLAYYLAEHGGWESTVVYFGPQEVHHADFEKYVRLVYLGDEAIYKNKYKLAKKYLKEHAKEMDVLMVFNYGTVSYGLSRTVKRYNPNALTYCKLDMSDGGFGHFNAQTPWRKLMSIGEIVKSRPIDLFTVESMTFYRALLKQRVFKKRLEYLPNGVSEVGIDLSSLDNVKKEKMLVTIGRLGNHHKNNELLLDAIEKLYEQEPALVKAWKFVFVGPSENGFSDRIENFKRKLPEIADGILMTGNLDFRGELYENCARASIICMTSRWESFGIATVEGMYFGCCPVITDYGSVAHDQVPDGVEWGVVVKQEAACVAEGIKRFMTRDNLSELNEKVRIFAREKFSYRLLSERLQGHLLRIRQNKRHGEVGYYD